MPTDNAAMAPVTDLIENDLVAAVQLDRATWEAQTSLGWTKTRSDKLVQLDKALEQYHAQHHTQAALTDLRYAADTWIASTPDSKREPKVISRLLLQMASAQDFQDRRIADALARNPEAARAIEAGRVLDQHSLKRVFLSPQWVIDHADDQADDNAPEPAESAAGTAQATAEAFRRIVHKNPEAERARQVEDTIALASTAIAVKDLVVGDAKEHIDKVKASFQEMCHGASPAEVFGSAGAAETFFKAAGTVFGAVVSPVTLLAKIVLTVKSAYDRGEIVAQREAFRFDPTTNPRAAFDGLDALLTREVRGKVVDVVGTAAGLAALAIPVAGAAVSSAVQAFVGAGMRAHAMALEKQEMAAGAEMLAKGQIGPELFKACPLLGCYFMCLADTSSLVNYAKTDIFDPAFTNNMRELVKKIEPSIARAREFIWSSAYALEGTDGLKGLEWEPRFAQHKIDFITRLLSLTRALRTLNRVCKHPAPDIGPAAPDAFVAFLAYDKRLTEDLVAQEEAAAGAEPPPAVEGSGEASGEPTDKRGDLGAASPEPAPAPAPATTPEPAPVPVPPKLDLLAGLGDAMSASTDAAQPSPPPVQTGIKYEPFVGTGGGAGAGGSHGPLEDEIDVDPKTDKPDAATLKAAER